MALPDPPPSATPPGVRDPEPEARPETAHIERLLEVAGRSAHYQVVSLLGAGGLGAVYKAIDTRLKRPVAIKTMRAASLLDARAAARLRAEALAAASLDHPYICKMYELIDTGSEPLIVMEFLEGETLAAVLARGVPPLATTVRVALEIAEGLAGAHAHGLVHRDVKPANVMITPHGHVKLLDFGLALADATATSTVDTRIAAPASDAYAGTPHYLSPEQAAGRPVTARADLFSFGVLLFECLTGSLPFRGSGAYEYVRRLQTDPPARMDRLAPAVPSDLARLVEWCLEKSPADRPASAADVVTHLRRVADSLTASGGRLRTVGGVRRRARLGVGAVGVFSVGALVLSWYAFRNAATTPVWNSRPFVSTSAEESESRISPDARWISFISNAGGSTELRVQRIDGGEAQRIQVPDGVLLSQVWSPDGSQIACALRQGDTTRLVLVPAFFGGTPLTTVVVMQTPGGIRLLRWMGRTVYFAVSDRSGRSLSRAVLDRGGIEPVSGTWNVEGTLRDFDVRPDGRRVVFTMAIKGQEDLWAADLDGSSLARITNDAFFERHPIWSGGGESVIYQSNRGGQIDVWETLLDSGTSRPLTSSPTAESPDATSPDGRLVSFQQSADEAHIWMWDGDAARQLTDDALADSSPTAARAGGRVVFQRSRPSGLAGNPISDSRLFIGALEPNGTWSTPRALTDGFAPLLSPDGLRLAHLQMSAGAPRASLLVRDLQSDQNVVVSKDAVAPGYNVFPADWAEPQMTWTASGEDLYYIDRMDGWAVRRFRWGARAGESPLAKASPAEILHGVSVSQDGQRLAYLATARSGSTLHVLDLADATDRGIRLDGVGYPYLRGWLTNGSGVVLVRQLTTREDLTADMETLIVSPSGTVRKVGQTDRVFVATSRLESAREVLYVTRLESGVHNLYALSLATGALRRATANTHPGVTFAGFEPLDRGRWLGVRAERTSDIWFMEKSAR